MVDPSGFKIEYSTTADPKVTPLTPNEIVDDGIEAVYDVRPRNRAERRLYRFRGASDACRTLRGRTVLRQSLESYLD